MCGTNKFWLSGSFVKSINCIYDAAVANSSTDTMSAARS